MDKIKLDILGLSSSQSQSGSFALVLGEENGNRRLPIIIGMFEAQAIAIEIEKVVPNRPMTHDLFKSFAGAFNYSVEEILISDLKEGVFFSKIVCSDGIRQVEIDARPSDAIAIGIRFDVPIFTYESILSEAGIVLNEFNDEEDEDEDDEGDDEDDIDAPDDALLEKDVPKMSSKDDVKKFSIEQLRVMLDDAIQKEDYEKAAKIRDELSQRN